MRRLLKLFIFNIISFGGTAYLLPAIDYAKNLEILAKSALIYALLSMFLKPVLSMLALPINFFTFGLFSWTINVIILYLVTRLEPGFKIISYEFPGFFYQGFIIPRIAFGTFGTVVLISFLISLIASFLIWVSD